MEGGNCEQHFESAALRRVVEECLGGDLVAPPGLASDLLLLPLPAILEGEGEAPADADLVALDGRTAEQLGRHRLRALHHPGLTLHQRVPAALEGRRLVFLYPRVIVIPVADRAQMVA